MSPTSSTIPTIPPLPSSSELRELLCEVLQKAYVEADELRALIRIAKARECGRLPVQRRRKLTQAEIDAYREMAAAAGKLRQAQRQAQRQAAEKE